MVVIAAGGDALLHTAELDAGVEARTQADETMCSEYLTPARLHGADAYTCLTNYITFPPRHGSTGIARPVFHKSKLLASFE